MPPLPHNLEYVAEMYSEFELPTPKVQGNLCKNLPILASESIDEISAPSGIDASQPGSPLPPIMSASLASSSTSSENLYLKDTKMLLNDRIINNQDTNATNIPTKKHNEKSSFQTVLDSLIEAFTRNCLMLSEEDRYYPDPKDLEIDVTYSGFDDAETLSSISTPSKVGGHDEEDYYIPWVDM